jgi:alkanesulfonate monooxygenase SsuD/methylene tetrahydromethanopterin reductase-like flavin-dependent oxidoreductase (luciferase family)
MLCHQRERFDIEDEPIGCALGPQLCITLRRLMLEAMTARETVDFAKTNEKHGYKSLWIPEGPGRDPFAHSAYLLSHAESLAIATGIANIWARDAIAMASAARTVAEISDERFILGIGVSHKPVIANRGHTYDKPYS